MKIFTSIIAITLVAFVVAPFARAEDNSAVETKLKQMEDAWEKAIVAKDSTAVGNMVAEDYAGVNSKGQHQNKTQMLDEMKTDTDTVTEATNDNMEVHVYGASLATVVGTSSEKGKGKHGKQFSRSFGWVDTWMERNGKWECIAEAVTMVPNKK